MTNQSIKWIDATPARAPPVALSEWEQYQEELRCLYNIMTLEDVMTTMKIRWQFCPSKRQYVTQFQKWGIYKYGRKHDQEQYSSSNRVQGTKDETRNSPQQISLISASQVSKSPPGCERQQNDKKPTVPPKNSKLSGATIQQLSTNFATPKNVEQSISETSLNSSPNSNSSATYTSSPMKASHFVDHETNPNLKSQDELAYSHFTVRHSSLNLSDLMDLDAESPSTSGDYVTVTPTLQCSTSPERTPTSMLAPLNTEQIDDAKLAADFLFATRLYDDSFEVYSKLLSCLEFQPSSEQFAVSCIIGCARSVSKASQASSIRFMLERKIADGIYKSKDNARTALFRLLLADVCSKSGDETSAKAQKRLAQQESDDSAGYYGAKRTNPFDYDLVVYKYLIKELKRKGQLLTARDITKHFISYQNRNTGKNSASSQNVGLRSCLHWCITQLEDDCQLYGSWRILMSTGALEMEVHNTALFCELWSRWQQQCNGVAGFGVNSNPSLVWVHEVEQRMGISPAECLMIMSRTILRAYPSALAFLTVETAVHGIEVRDLVIEQRIARRALFAARELYNTSGDEIMLAFLDAFIDHYRPMAKSPKTHTYQDLSRGYLKAYLQNSLRIQLSDSNDGGCYHERDEESNFVDNAIAAFDQEYLYYDNSGSSLLPTLAKSLSSMDLDSLECLKARIENGFTGKISTESLLSHLSIDDSELQGLLSNPSIASAIESAKTAKNFISNSMKNGWVNSFSAYTPSQRAF